VAGVPFNSQSLGGGDLLELFSLIKFIGCGQLSENHNDSTHTIFLATNNMGLFFLMFNVLDGLHDFTNNRHIEYILAIPSQSLT
jgi:hypothetical protein